MENHELSRLADNLMRSPPDESDLLGLSNGSSGWMLEYNQSFHEHTLMVGNQGMFEGNSNLGLESVAPVSHVTSNAPITTLDGNQGMFDGNSNLGLESVAPVSRVTSYAPTTTLDGNQGMFNGNSNLGLESVAPVSHVTNNRSTTLIANQATFNEYSGRALESVEPVVSEVTNNPSSLLVGNQGRRLSVGAKNKAKAECYPDLEAVEELRRIIEKGEDNTYAVKTHFILDPRVAEAQFITTCCSYLLEDNFPVPDVGCWKRYDRELGWGVRDVDGHFIGFKRTYAFHLNDGSKTSWIMNVYALIEDGGIHTSKFLCQVFQDSVYKARPRSLMRPMSEPLTYQPDSDAYGGPHGLGSSSRGEYRVTRVIGADSLDKYGGGQSSSPSPSPSPFMALWRSVQPKPSAMDRLNNKLTSMPEDVNDIYGEDWRACSHPSFLSNIMAPATGSSSSTGTAAGKKRKMDVRFRFVDINATDSNGRVVPLSFCKCCGMAYKKSSGSRTLNGHTCTNK